MNGKAIIYIKAYFVIIGSIVCERYASIKELGTANKEMLKMIL